MPIVVLLLMLAPMGIAVQEIQNEHVKENKVNEMCIQKFNTPEDIKSCKTIMMKMDITRGK